MIPYHVGERAALVGEMALVRRPLLGPARGPFREARVLRPRRVHPARGIAGQRLVVPEDPQERLDPLVHRELLPGNRITALQPEDLVVAVGL